MSVPVGERSEGRFSLLVKAEFLTRYTMLITANDKVFTPAYQKALTDDIIDTAKNIYLGLREANDISVRVGTEFQRMDYRERNRLQREAFRNTKRLLYLIDLAHRVFHLSSRRVKYWAELVLEVKDRTYGWIESDNHRYGDN